MILQKYNIDTPNIESSIYYTRTIFYKLLNVDGLILAIVTTIINSS